MARSKKRGRSLDLPLQILSGYAFIYPDPSKTEVLKAPIVKNVDKYFIIITRGGPSRQTAGPRA
jgi:hypothetical protein